MVTATIDNREPLLLEAGDTIQFNKNLPDYLPSAGWSLLYQVSGYPIGMVAPQFDSTPDSTNTFHQINVAAGTTAAWLPGQYVLTGYAVNATANPPERVQIYYAEFVLAPNLGTGINPAVTTTHAQRMIPLLEAQLEQLALHALQATNIQQTEIIRVKRKELQDQLAWNKTIRANEIAQENVNNGRPSGNKIVPRFNIISTGGPGISPQNPFIPNT